MAQWRPLHRRITASEKVIELADDPFALWLYCALLPYTDADGRLNGNPAGLAGTIFEGYPYTTQQIEDGLHALARVGLIVLYRNARYQFLVEYTKFQEMCKPDKREARSELPGPTDEDSEAVTGTLPEAPPEPSPEPSGTPTGSLPEDSAKTPRLHEHEQLHEHVDEHEQTRARSARSAAGSRKNQPKKRKPKTSDFDPHQVTLPEFVSHEAWTDFVEHRSALKKPLTKRAAELTLTELAKTPLEADRMLRRSVANGWTGVYARDDQRPTKAADTTALDQYTERGL